MEKKDGWTRMIKEQSMKRENATMPLRFFGGTMILSMSPSLPSIFYSSTHVSIFGFNSSKLLLLLVPTSPPLNPPFYSYSFLLLFLFQGL